MKWVFKNQDLQMFSREYVIQGSMILYDSV